MVPYQERDKLKGGGIVSRELEDFNKGKGRLGTKDLSYGKVSKYGFETGTGISTKEGVVFTNASVFEAEPMPIFPIGYSCLEREVKEVGEGLLGM